MAVDTCGDRYARRVGGRRAKEDSYRSANAGSYRRGQIMIGEQSSSRLRWIVSYAPPAYSAATGKSVLAGALGVVKSSRVPKRYARVPLLLTAKVIRSPPRAAH